MYTPGNPVDCDWSDPIVMVLSCFSALVGRVTGDDAVLVKELDGEVFQNTPGSGG